MLRQAWTPMQELDSAVPIDAQPGAPAPILPGRKTGRAPGRPLDGPAAMPAGCPVQAVAPGEIAVFGTGQTCPPRVLVHGGTLLLAGSADAGASAIDILSGRALFMHEAVAGASCIYVGPEAGLSFEHLADASGARIRHDGILMLGHIEGEALTVGSLCGTGAVHLGPAMLRLGALGEHDVFGGTLSDGARGGRLQKVGPGTLTLSGTCLYRGDTWVDGGCLRVDGSLQGSRVFVGAGARLAGSGCISMPCTLEAGATLAPGNGGRALQLGRLHAAPGSTLAFALGPDGGGDRLDAGALALDGAVLDLSGPVRAGRTLLLGYASLERRDLAIGRLPPGLRREDVRVEYEDHRAYLAVRRH
ncbi:hypothetical protein V8Z80_17340 [Orrella sp. JC864]|uniref:autotransporter-associated beta strand repeat-containing protein n=1 Tax=Orrella sp. JC864 TaxID=3120298 RepID=UPI00300A8F98